MATTPGVRKVCLLRLHLAKANFFFDLCHCSISTLNWILYGPIWKRCRFRFNINKPLFGTFKYEDQTKQLNFPLNTSAKPRVCVL